MSGVSGAMGVVEVPPKQIVAGTNITISETDTSVTINSTGGGGSSTWGGITGTLSNQIDLQNALNLKADSSSVPAQFNPIQGSNMVLSGTYPNITFSSTGGGGGGTTVNTGSATLNFGSAPGTNFVSVAVTGQALITGSSKIKVYKSTQATATHNDYEHMIVPLELTAGSIVAGTGFTIYANTNLRLSGTFNINWEWV